MPEGIIDSAIAWALIVAAAVASSVLVWVVVTRARRQAPNLGDGEPQLQLSADDRGVRLTVANREVRSLEWDDIDLVRLRTTADGPFTEDVFWELELRDGSGPLTIPNGASGVDSLLQVAPRYLPEFDHEAVIEAMTSVEPATFMVWERDEI